MMRDILTALLTPDKLCNNAIAQAEINYLEQSGTRRWWHYLLLGGSLLIAAPYLAARLLPTFFYPGFPHVNPGQIQPGPGPYLVLLMMVAGSYLFAALVIVQASIIGLQSINREVSTGCWQVLHLTRLSKWQIISGKWRGAVYFLRRDVVLASIPPVLMTYSVMVSDYLYLFDIQRADSMCTPVWGVLRAYCQIMLAGGITMQTNPIHLTMLDNLLIAAVVSILLGRAVVGLTAAVGQLTALLAQNNIAVQMGFLWTTRFLISMALLSSMIGLAAWKESAKLPMAPFAHWMCSRDRLVQGLDCETASRLHQLLRGTETLEVGLMPLIDGGALLRINLMQPSASSMFMLRTLISTALALGLYSLLTWCTLKLAAQCSTQRTSYRTVEILPPG